MLFEIVKTCEYGKEILILYDSSTVQRFFLSMFLRQITLPMSIFAWKMQNGNLNHKDNKTFFYSSQEGNLFLFIDIH